MVVYEGRTRNEFTWNAIRHEVAAFIIDHADDERWQECYSSTGEYHAKPLDADESVASTCLVTDPAESIFAPCGVTPPTPEDSLSGCVASSNRARESRDEGTYEGCLEPCDGLVGFEPDCVIPNACGSGSIGRGANFLEWLANMCPENKRRCVQATIVSQPRWNSGSLSIRRRQACLLSHRRGHGEILRSGHTA